MQTYEKKQTPEYVGPSLVGGQGLVKVPVCSLFSQSFLCYDKQTCPQIGSSCGSKILVTSQQSASIAGDRKSQFVDVTLCTNPKIENDGYLGGFNNRRDTVEFSAKLALESDGGGDGCKDPNFPTTRARNA